MIIDHPLPSQIPSLKKLWQEAFGDTEEFLNTFEKHAFGINRCRCISENNEVIAALYWFECQYLNHRIAYLYAIATAKAHRGRGLCHKLMENTHRHLKELGYAGTILVPGNQSLFAFYQRMGYQTCSYVRNFDCLAEQSELDIKPIDINEYAKLRRQFLPHGGVIQEKENLTFLKAQAEFYSGKNLLLAARKEGELLYGLELLGDQSTAPRIVFALGCKKGSFRGVGKEQPFAMYLPFAPYKFHFPSYFGLAFD